MLADTRRDLECLNNLHPEVAVLRDDLLGYLFSRIPASEMAWHGLLHLGVTYPDEVVKRKFQLLQEKFVKIDWQCTPDHFLNDYKKIRGAINDLVCAGATMKGINFDAVAADSDLGKGWFMYTDLARAVSPTSAEAERVFSTLSRLRSKFRRHLYVHLSACVRVSQAKTLGCGIDGEDIIDEILKDWSLVKHRRRRPIG